MEKKMFGTEGKTALLMAATARPWTEARVDLLKKIDEADALDKRFGSMLRIALEFGLRLKEVVRCVPHRDDQGTHLRVASSCSRERLIPVSTPEQRAALDRVKACVPPNERLVWSHTTQGDDATVAYVSTRYAYLKMRIGVTNEMRRVAG